MGFRENLLKKIQINRLVDTVLRSMGPADSGQRMDRDTMRRLLEMGGYRHHKERDIDLFRLAENEFLALDNELKIYRTSAEDIALRKSPTVKEMISIRNAIKILNDKDVVVSRRAESVARIRNDLIGSLDLSYTTADIEALSTDGSQASANGYADGVLEILALFAELLGFQKAPEIFQLPHHHIWGVLAQPRPEELRFGPLVMFSLMHNSLKMIQTPISSLDKDGLAHFRKIARTEDHDGPTGEMVWDVLKKAVLDKHPH